MTKAIDVTTIDVLDVNPEQKDIDRAEGLAFHRLTFHGDGSPWVADARKMAKAIKDPYKLVRRAKAVVDRWSTKYTPYYDSFYSRMVNLDDPRDVWTPFKNRLAEMGFNDTQIKIIADYDSDYLI